MIKLQALSYFKKGFVNQMSNGKTGLIKNGNESRRYLSSIQVMSVSN